MSTPREPLTVAIAISLFCQWIVMAIILNPVENSLGGHITYGELLIVCIKLHEIKKKKLTYIVNLILSSSGESRVCPILLWSWFMLPLSSLEETLAFWDQFYT